MEIGRSYMSIFQLQLRDLSKEITLLFAVLFLSACGGGGGSDSAPQPPTPSNVELAGAAVKGPLSGADVRIYQVDATAADLKGALQGTTTTGNDGRFNFSLPATPTHAYYLIDVLATNNTVDVSTGRSPVITTMQSLISAEALVAKQAVYATPLTSLVTRLVAMAAPGDDEAFKKTLANKTMQLKSELGLGLLQDKDIFHTAAMAAHNSETLENVLAHRTAIEAFSGLVWQVAKQQGVAVEDVIDAMAMDMYDGKLDGMSLPEFSSYKEDIAMVYQISAAQNIGLLEIPHTLRDKGDDTSGALLVGEMVQLLARETEELDASRNTDSLKMMPQKIIVAPISPDYDGDGQPNVSDADMDNDGVKNEDDALPLNELETHDTDVDGVGDNSDAYPEDPACHQETAGNGTQCYVTVTERMTLIAAEAGADSLVYLLFREEAQYSLYVWNPESVQFEAQLDVSDDGISPYSMRYHPQHKRLYLAYSSGKIRYFTEGQAGVLHDLIEMPMAASSMAAVGNYLLLADAQGAWSSHHVVSPAGTLLDSQDWNSEFGHYAWSDKHKRIYYFFDRHSPNDVYYQEIAQQDGKIGAKEDSPHHGDYQIKGPILLLDDESRVLLGSGDVYSASTLKYQETVTDNFDFGHIGDEGLVSLTRNALGASSLVAYDKNFDVIQTANFAGLPEAFVPLGERYLVISNPDLDYRAYHLVDLDKDVDDDGVLNALDAFPNDPAASLDTDRDGYPDAWNSEVVNAVESGRLHTPLQLDAFPSDSACQLVTHGVDGFCDLSARVKINKIDSYAIKQNIVYTLDTEQDIVNRWDTQTNTPLNPLPLRSGATQGEALSIAVTPSSKLLVGYSSGDLVEIVSTSVQKARVVKRLPAPVQKIQIAGQYYLLVTGVGEYYRDFHVLSSAYKTTGFSNNGSWSSDYQYNAALNRFYWSGNTYSDSLLSTVVRQSTGELQGFSSFTYAQQPASFIRVSDDGSLIVMGDAQIISDYPAKPQKRELPLQQRIAAGKSDGQLLDFRWHGAVSVALLLTDEHYVLAVFDKDVRQWLFDYPLSQTNIDSVLGLPDALLVLAQDTQTQHYVFQRLTLLVDKDKDGLPYWWELQYGLDDDSNLDALTDSDGDGLNALAEFLASTSPILGDTDGDGLSDAVELNSLGTNPLLEDSDGDFMPDNWEVEASLDPLDSSDASNDNDDDGVDNLVEFIMGTNPLDAASFPAALSNVYYSFEDQTLPGQWALSGDVESVEINDEEAQHGQYSVQIDGSASIEWARVFAPVELSFALYNTCSSTYYKQVHIELGDKSIREIVPDAGQWSTHSVRVPAGFHRFKLRVESRSQHCQLRLDAIEISPLQSVYESGNSWIAQANGNLYLADEAGLPSQAISIPAIQPHTNDQRDITVLEDGRIAVFNGSFTPVLSIYNPATHQWRSLSAAAWSMNYSSNSGGLASQGNIVYAADYQTYERLGNGYVRFDLDDDSISYVAGIAATDIAIGLDDDLYLSNGATIQKFNASTSQLLSELTLPDHGAIAVDALGHIFTVDWQGAINKYNAQGVLLNSLTLEDRLVDVDVRSNGDLLVTDHYGRVYRSDRALLDAKPLQQTAEFTAFVPGRDSDADGLPDWWENSNGMNANDDSDIGQDIDGDGLTAQEEYQYGTNNQLADSDADGLSDGDEVNQHLSHPLLLDTDDDGLNDGAEVDEGSDPNIADTDSDGLSDAEEVLTHGTSPTSSDTDNDGMDDAYEVLYALDATTDDSANDADNDGLTNLQEFNANTNPLQSDSDGDGLDDGAEINTHGTSPLNPDSDNDHMRDDWELLYALDPLDDSDALLDPDGDAFSSREEFYNDSAPDQASSKPSPIEWVSHQGDRRHLGYSPLILDSADFSVNWTSALSVAGTLQAATAAEGKIFVSNFSRFGEQTLMGLDASDGSVLWRLDYDGIHSIDPPAYSNGNVYFLTGGHEDSFIRSVDAGSGSLNFATRYGNQWSRWLAPVIADGTVYMGGGYYGGLYAFDAQLGTETWFAGTPQYQKYSPAIDNEYAYVFIDNLYAYNRHDGSLAFSINYAAFDWNGYTVGAAPVLTRSNNIIASQNGTLVVLDLDARAISWQLKSNFSAQASSALGRIYILDAGILKVFDEFTGVLLWSWEAPSSLVSNIVVTSNMVFVGDENNTYGIAIASRQQVWSYAASGDLTLNGGSALLIAGSELVSIKLIP